MEVIGYPAAIHRAVRGNSKQKCPLDFAYQWLRLHHARADWQSKLKPCLDQLKWGTKKFGWGKVNRTSGIKSSISHMNIQPTGQFSRIFIQSRTFMGLSKKVGGDHWMVYFVRPSTVEATVFDHENGTYEAVALLVDAGTYSIHAYP